LAKNLEEWLDTDVREARGKSIRWLSEQYFFRDPLRPVHNDAGYFFSPADGVLLYQMEVEADECVVDVKGQPYSVREALREPDLEGRFLVAGIFMTFYDVHVNRVPYAGLVSYKELEPIGTTNQPMLAVELGLVDEGLVDLEEIGDVEYLHENQRMVNTVRSPRLGQSYYVLQVADYDVDCITPFELKQNRPFSQNARFSQIRYGSQVDLIVPLTGRLELETLHEPGMHVEAGVDRLFRIVGSRAT